METQRKPLTLREHKLVKGVAAGKTKRQAAIDAGYSGKTPEVVSTIASNTLKKVNVQEALHEELARQGITLEAIVKPIADGLKAKIGKTPDHAIRLRSSSMAAQFLGIGKNTGDVTMNFYGHAGEQRATYELS